MKPFVVPAWRKRQIRDKFRRKDQVTNRAVDAMEEVMLEAVEAIMLEYQRTGRYHEPTLEGMFGVSANFYLHVATSAIDAAKHEKQEQVGKKRLAAKLPPGAPKTIAELEKVFRDKRTWPAMMKRSKKLTERLRQAYLQKLRRRFAILTPQLTEGEITVEQAKAKLMNAWDASKARVTTIFRTETTKYFATVQVAYFEQDDEIIGFLFDSISDKSRTPICRSRHGLIYRPGSQELRKNTPALHYNCRSHLIALANIAHNRKLLEDPKRDPAKVTVAPLPPGWRT